MRGRRALGPGRFRGSERPRPLEGRAHPPVVAAVGGARVHAAMVEHPRDGGAVRGDRLHLRTGSASVGPERFAAARVGPRVGRRCTGAVAGRVGTCRGPCLP